MKTISSPYNESFEYERILLIFLIEKKTSVSLLR